MSKKDNQWSFGDELFELRSWDPQRSSLGKNWRSVASEMLTTIKPSSKSASGVPSDKDE